MTTCMVGLPWNNGAHKSSTFSAIERHRHELQVEQAFALKAKTCRPRPTRSSKVPIKPRTRRHQPGSMKRGRITREPSVADGSQANVSRPNSNNSNPIALLIEQPSATNTTSQYPPVDLYPATCSVESPSASAPRKELTDPRFWWRDTGLYFHQGFY
jgi:hypothetical protein